MPPPTYTLTLDQLRRLHGAAKIEIKIDLRSAAPARSKVLLSMTCLYQDIAFAANQEGCYTLDPTSPSYELNLSADLQNKADACVEMIEECMFKHMRPRMRKHLASLPAHALRKSIHQIEDEWLNVLDKPWLDFVSREIQLAQLEETALSTEH